MTYFRKNPIVVPAVRWMGNNVDEVVEFVGPIGDARRTDFDQPGFRDHWRVDGRAQLYVAANGAWLEIERGEWIIRDDRGCYPCKAEVFDQTYTVVPLQDAVGSASYSARHEPFYLVRHTDHTGISGTGIVAEGVQFSDGSCAIRWKGAHRSTVVWDSIDSVRAIHGHQGSTEIVWGESWRERPVVDGPSVDGVAG